MTASGPRHRNQLEELLDARLQALATPLRYYRIAVHRFLSFLQTDFPEVCCLSDLRGDPHLVGWLHSFGAEEPPLSHSSQRIYLVALRRLLRDLASAGHAIDASLIGRAAVPARPSRPRQSRPTKDRRQPLPHPIFGDVFDACIQTIAATLKPVTVSSYRVVARNFLVYLHSHFPDVRQLSELRRTPHWVDWLRSLGEQPSLSEITRQKYRLRLRALFQQLASHGHLLHDELLLIEDLPSPLRRTNDQLPHPTLGTVFEEQIKTLATTLRPSTIDGYRHTTRRFLGFLQTHYPHLHQLSDLRRDPHWLAWLRSLYDQQPSLSNATRQGYLLALRRLLADLAFQGHSIPSGLILPEDFPPRPQYLPRSLSPEDDQRLQQQLRRRDDLLSNALLLTRATGIRIGECIDLALDCLRLLGQDQWAVHVPLGKLHTERLVPADEDVRQTVARILTLRTTYVYSKVANAAKFLLPQPYGRARVYHSLSYALAQAAEQAGCTHRVTCHQLRHTYATEMIRAGLSLPALMKLLGHKDIRMTLRYIQVTQQDLQREYYGARQNAVNSQFIPTLSLLKPDSPVDCDVTAILQAIGATTHLVEMYRRHSADEATSKKLRRLAQRLLSVASEFRRFATAER